MRPKPEFVPGCTGKKAFARFTQAEEAAKRLNRRDGSAHVEAYHCKHCNGAHVGENRDYKREKKTAGVEE